jgi:Cu2+-exporting ATPase
VTARPLTGSLVIEYDPGRTTEAHLLSLLVTISGARASRRPRRAEPAAPASVSGPRESPAAWLSLLGTTAVLAASFLPLPAPGIAALILASASPSLLKAGHALVVRRRLNVDVLDGTAIALLVLRGNYRAAGLLPWLLSLGNFVLARTVTGARRSLRVLLASPEQVVWKVTGQRRVRARVASLAVGDLIAVGAGQRLPVDGTVVEGEALVDQRSITGEGLPVERRTGDAVYAFTVVEDGEIVVRADQVGLETSVGRIIEAIETTAGEKPELQLIAERLADRAVVRTLMLAGVGAAVSRSLDAGVAILVADYGMAGRVVVPTAVLASIMHASRAGILIKGPRLVEKLARVDTVVFDKTGTLTLGMPRVSRVVTYDPAFGADEIVRLAAAAEQGLRHPAARAVVRAAHERRLVPPERTGVEARLGLGVRVSVDDTTILVGSRRFMESQDVALERALDDEAAAHASGGSSTFVAAEGRLAGLLVLIDELRADAQQAVADLRARRMRNVIMVSGDHPEPTRVIAATLGVRHYYADLLPEDKASLIRRLRAEDRVVAMVGDGVNDALALREADVGIAVQGGVEVVTEAAGVVLTLGGLEKVVQAIDVARHGVASVQRTFDAAVRGNVAAVALASFGVAGPFTAILLTNGAAILAALSALRAPGGSRAGRKSLEA